MNVIGYDKAGSILIEYDGNTLIVPDDSGNRHRQMIAEWEAHGNTIPPYAAPASTMPALTPRQLWLAALQAGVTKASVLQAIESLQDPEEREYLRIEIQEATSFVRSHPAVDMLIGMIGMPKEQIDALWLWAANL